MSVSFNYINQGSRVQLSGGSTIAIEPLKENQKVLGLDVAAVKKTLSFLDQWRLAPTILFNQQTRQHEIVLLNKRSLEKRLQVPTLQTFQQKRKAEVKERGSKRETGKWASRLSALGLKISSLELEEGFLEADLQKEGMEPGLIGKTSSGRSIFFHEGKTYLVLDRKNAHRYAEDLDDPVVGTGANLKEIRYALNEEGALFVLSSWDDDLGNEVLHPSQYEPEILKMAQGEKTVRLFGTYKQAGKTFLLQEFCNGGTLADKSKPTRLDHLRHAKEAVEGLIGLHKKQIVHGDIKPENLFNTNGDVRFGDFGSARKLNQPKHAYGTALYLSPEDAREKWEKEEKLKEERYRNRGLQYEAQCNWQNELNLQPNFDYGKKSDVYSLGMSLYRIFIGSLPDEEIENPEEVVEKVACRDADFMPEPLDHNSIEHVIWEMIRWHPDHRISLEDALLKIKALYGEEHNQCKKKISEENAFSWAAALPSLPDVLGETQISLTAHSFLKSQGWKESFATEYAEDLAKAKQCVKKAVQALYFDKIRQASLEGRDFSIPGSFHFSISDNSLSKVLLEPNSNATLTSKSLAWEKIFASSRAEQKIREILLSELEERQYGHLFPELYSIFTLTKEQQKRALEELNPEDVPIIKAFLFKISYLYDLCREDPEFILAERTSDKRVFYAACDQRLKKIREKAAEELNRILDMAKLGPAAPPLNRSVLGKSMDVVKDVMQKPLAAVLSLVGGVFASLF